MFKLVGLTGGIGSGKSTIAEMIRGHGIPVMDADLVAREVVAPDQPAFREIAAAWPEVIARDGTLHRLRMGEVIFSDEGAKARLEAITHPRIWERITEQASTLAEAGHRLVFLEAALLVETGLYLRLDGLVVVAASEANQVQRVMTRDACSREHALARVRAQQPLAEKLRVASHVIDNDGTLEITRRQLSDILRALAAIPA
jgi:dephospho-CoA kinase